MYTVKRAMQGLLFGIILSASSCHALAGQPVSVPASSNIITRERAEAIALEQAQGGKIVQTEFRQKKDGRAGYKVLAVDGDMVVEVKIDALQGRVMTMKRKNIETVKYPKNGSGRVFDDQGGIDTAKAREIALDRTGGGTVVELEKELKKDGRIVYEVEIVNPERKHEVKIDGRTGAIVEYEEKVPRHLRATLGRD